MIARKKVIGFLILMIFVKYSFGQMGEDKLAREAFDQYKSSILNDKGEEAVKYVNSKTIKYYDSLLELVKNADSSRVESLSILDKIMVFSVRHRTSKSDILSFDGKSLLVYAIKTGMVGKNSVANNSIGDIEVNKDFGKGQFISNGRKVPLFLHFYKEDNQWKIDLTSLFPISTMAFRKMVDDSGENENDYLFSLLEMVSGKKPSSSIWTPVLIRDN